MRANAKNSRRPPDRIRRPEVAAPDSRFPRLRLAEDSRPAGAAWEQRRRGFRRHVFRTRSHSHRFLCPLVDGKHRGVRTHPGDPDAVRLRRAPSASVNHLLENRSKSHLGTKTDASGEPVSIDAGRKEKAGFVREEEPAM